jgi:hypothetical protein
MGDAADETKKSARYRRRDLPHAVWEIPVIYSETDDRDHAVLFNGDDITWHKTLTVAETNFCTKAWSNGELWASVRTLKRSREPSVYRKERAEEARDRGRKGSGDPN